MGSFTGASVWCCLLVKVWRTVHHSAAPGRLLRRQPRVHTGFYQAWVAKGLNQQVLGHMQVLPHAAAAPHLATCSLACPEHM